MENTNLCPQCNKPLVLDTNLDSYLCTDCNEYFPKSMFEEIEPADKPLSPYSVLTCKLCGKRMIVKSSYDKGVCPFCYNNFIDIENGVNDYKPNFIIPFKDTLQSFKNGFYTKAKDANVPGELLANISEDSIKGAYFPFYIFTVENDANGFFETREVDDGYDDFSRQRMSYIENIDIVIDSTGTFTNEQIAKFANYNYKKIDMFFLDRLNDFCALYPSLNSDATWNEMKKVVKNHIESEIMQTKGKHEVIKDIKVFNDIKNLSRRLVLVPVWMIESHYNDETHYLYVNGQTDRMISDVPFEQVVKKSFFGKPKEENFQINILERDRYKRKVYKASIEYLNDLKKNEVNKNDRLANIRKIR